MKNNALQNIQRQRRLWFEITKREKIREQSQAQDSDSYTNISKEDEEPYEELVVSQR